MKSPESIYAILMTEGGANPDNGDDFSHNLRQHRSHMDTAFPFEWRFGGKLGFGGKYHEHRDDSYVSYYYGDETPERAALKKRIDALLEDV